MTLLDFILPWRWRGFFPTRATPALPTPAPAAPAAPALPARAASEQRRLARRRQNGRALTLTEAARKRATQLGAADRLIAGQHRADSLYNPLTGFGGSYDKGSSALPDLDRAPLGLPYLSQLYRFNGLAQRFVDIIPDDATRKGWTIEDGNPDTDPMKAETERLAIPERANLALKWGRAYGGGFILIVADERPDPTLPPVTRASEMLARPLKAENLIAIRNLIVLDRNEAQPATWENDLRNPRFGLARTWYLSPNSNASLADFAGVAVHHSRLLYFPGRRLPNALRIQNGGYDDSVLEAVWDQIRNKTGVGQAAATFAQALNYLVVKVEDLAAMKTGDQAAYVDLRMRQIAEGRSALNVTMLGPGESCETQASPVTGVDQLNAIAREDLCAVMGMPQTILFGEAPGGLNTDGESHRGLWSNVISAFQQSYLRDPLAYLYGLLYAAKEGPTRGVVPAKWEIKFAPLDELTEKEQAEVEKIHAETDASRVQSGILPPEHIAKSRFGPSGYSATMLPFDPDAFAQEEEARAMEQARELAAADIDPVTGRPRAAPLPGRTDAEDRYAVPAGARGNARQALAWREAHPDEIQGMQETGWRRARQLASEPAISRADMIEIAAWFARHGAQAGTRAVAPEFKDEPWRDAGYVAWLGWGGDTMRAKAQEVRDASADAAAAK